jgi:transcription elongation factor Elf1
MDLANIKVGRRSRHPMNEAEEFEFQCPRCGQGGLQSVILTPFRGRDFWICKECDSLWEQSESPRVHNPNDYRDYSEFMGSHGYTGDWSYVVGGFSG